MHGVEGNSSDATRLTIGSAVPVDVSLASVDFVLIPEEPPPPSSSVMPVSGLASAWKMLSAPRAAVTMSLSTTSSASSTVSTSSSTMPQISSSVSSDSLVGRDKQRVRLACLGAPSRSSCQDDARAGAGRLVWDGVSRETRGPGPFFLAAGTVVVAVASTFVSIVTQAATAGSSELEETSMLAVRLVTVAGLATAAGFVVTAVEVVTIVLLAVPKSQSFLLISSSVVRELNQLLDEDVWAVSGPVSVLVITAHGLTKFGRAFFVMVTQSEDFVELFAAVPACSSARPLSNRTPVRFFKALDTVASDALGALVNTFPLDSFSVSFCLSTGGLELISDFSARRSVDDDGMLIVSEADAQPFSETASLKPDSCVVVSWAKAVLLNASATLGSICTVSSGSVLT